MTDSGNCMNDPDTFDHNFFKRSPGKTMAINSRDWHSLQLAYQTVAQVGYYDEMESHTL